MRHNINSKCGVKLPSVIKMPAQKDPDAILNLHLYYRIISLSAFIRLWRRRSRLRVPLNNLHLTCATWKPNKQCFQLFPLSRGAICQLLTGRQKVRLFPSGDLLHSFFIWLNAANDAIRYVKCARFLSNVPCPRCVCLIWLSWNNFRLAVSYELWPVQAGRIKTKLT